MPQKGLDALSLWGLRPHTPTPTHASLRDASGGTPRWCTAPSRTTTTPVTVHQRKPNEDRGGRGPGTRRARHPASSALGGVGLVCLGLLLWRGGRGRGDGGRM